MPTFRNFTPWIALIQTLLVMIGFFGLVIVLKISGYPDTPFRWSPWAVFLREHGIWLITVPVLWTLLTVLVQRRYPQGLGAQLVHLLGIFMAGGILVMFLHAVSFPYTIPLWIHVR